MDLRSGGDDCHSGSNARNSRKMILTSATEVRDESSRATRLTFFRLLSLVARTTLRTAERDPTQTSGTIRISEIRWYSMTGTSATSTSPLASISAQRDGDVSVTSSTASR